MRKSLSQVFVELPPSRTLLKHSHVSSAGHKENALSRPSASQMSSSTPPAPAHSKRKLDVDTPVADEPATKKHKQPKDSIPTQSVANTNDEYPNGFVYCHQCNKKRDTTSTSHFFPQPIYSHSLSLYPLHYGGPQGSQVPCKVLQAMPQESLRSSSRGHPCRRQK